MSKNNFPEQRGFDRFAFQKNKADSKLKEFGREAGVGLSEIQSLLTAGWQKVQFELYKLEAVLKPDDVQLAYASVGADSGFNKKSFDSQTVGFAPERKRLILTLVTMIFLMIFLASCASGPTGGPDVIVPTTVATETANVPPATEAGGNPIETATAMPFDELSIDYGRYAGQENVIDPVIENSWNLMNQYIFNRGLAAPSAVKLVDVSSNNIIVEVLQQGRTDDYPAGTHFTISFVTGHQGETLTISLDGANSVCENRAVQLAIVADGLPVALDANGVVVAYVDGQTGQWTAGERGLAPELVTKPYAEMTDQERLQYSQALVERANTYDGLVEVFPDVEGGENYPTYWSPTAAGEYKLGLGSWRSAHNTPESELDMYGESFPDLTVPGIENPDGTFALIDPATGNQIVLPRVNLPGIGEVSLRDLYRGEHGGQNLANYITDLMLQIYQGADIGGQGWTQTDAQRNVARFFPGWAVGPQNNFFALLQGAGTSSVAELPEAHRIYREMPTNSFYIPVFSPETGDFMFFLNVQQGNLPGTQDIRISSSGGATFASRGNFHENDDLTFAVLSENQNKFGSYYEAGSAMLLDDQAGICNVTQIYDVLTASTEQEIFDILGQAKMCISHPARVAIFGE
ncbi:MAG: hypothetical protein COU63_04180 [Candidatus Pacebacteria bacterium CG10_big_fil_rev_8_21_14_0_10_36_11]|nr:MAG: hypothetical protein COU63_04180 [Candidatus Pacebacteria bacterium CG10_big_fil_rev_8_21_14_0_10_36_11]